MGGAVGSVATPPDPPAVTAATTRNLQQLLQKLTVEEKNKPHQFWDTQPVPKLGEGGGGREGGGERQGG